MIGESIPIMTAIDCLIFGAAFYLVIVLYKNYHAVRKLGLTRGVNLVLAGLLVTALFFLIDLMSMVLLPAFVSKEVSMAFMTHLHLNEAWIVGPVAMVSIAGGMSYMVRVLIPRVSITLEELEDRSIRQTETIRDSIGTLQKEIHARIEVEEKVKFSKELLEYIQRAQSEYILDIEPTVLFERLLNGILDLTGSEYGFIGEIRYDAHGSPYLRTQYITDISWDENTRILYQEFASSGLEFYNLKTLFGSVMTTGRPVIANAPSGDDRSGGLPKGHPPLRAFLGLPFFQGSKLVGMVGIANRPEGYTEELVEDLKPLLSTCAAIIESHRNHLKKLEAEEALIRSEAHNRTLTEYAPEAILIIDLDTGIVTDCNHNTEKLFGYDREELLGRTLFDLSPPDQPDGARSEEKIQWITTHAQSTDGQLVFEYTFSNREKQQVPCEVRFVKLPSKDRLLVRGSFIDITDRKRAEEEREIMEARLLQTQKLESLGVLAGGIAHDFNNLLVGILGHAGIAMMKLDPGLPAREHVEKIEFAAQRAAELISQMLVYSGQGRRELRPLDLNALIDEMTSLLKMSISHRVVFNCECGENLASVDADATQVRQVLMNLLMNASEALVDGSGVITLRTGMFFASAADLSEFRLTEELLESSYVFLEVSDSGIGMDLDTQNKMFDPFFTTKFSGRGLGLAAVLGIVKGHRGAIKVRSLENTGTTVTVLFPAAAAEPGCDKNDQARRTSGSVSRCAGGVVLVIDDEEMVAEVARGILEMSGFEVLTALNGTEGVEMFRRKRDEITAVLLDQTMPGMDGRAVFRQIRRLRGDVPIILSSGYTEGETMGELKGADRAGFIQKPYAPRTLVETLSSVLDRAP